MSITTKDLQNAAAAAIHNRGPVPIKDSDPMKTGAPVQWVIEYDPDSKKFLLGPTDAPVDIPPKFSKPNSNGERKELELFDANASRAEDDTNAGANAGTGTGPTRRKRAVNGSN